MSTVMRQDPWGVMPRLQEEINRLFGNTRETDSSSATANWVPPVDIHEYPNRFELYVDLPGIDPADVELTLDGGVLTLSGDRREQLATKNGEDLQGRRVDTVDGEKVNATGKNGVLTVTIPKQAKAMPRRIQIDG
jgi:HSP20 family protein